MGKSIWCSGKLDHLDRLTAYISAPDVYDPPNLAELKAAALELKQAREHSQNGKNVDEAMCQACGGTGYAYHSHFNYLRPDEQERLAMLAEEAGEIVQIVGKILRHGYESHHPSDPKQTPNRHLLDKELRDLIAVHVLMMERGDLAEIPASSIPPIIERKLRFTHHQSKGN
jgi:hypothetical protein